MGRYLVVMEDGLEAGSASVEVVGPEGSAEVLLPPLLVPQQCERVLVQRRVRGHIHKP